MSPVLRCLASALLICCPLLGAAGWIPSPPTLLSLSGGQPGAANLTIAPSDDAIFLKRWRDPSPGTKAFVGLRERGVIDLTRRDCLPNGTNFCFGDDVNFCANCGTCCVSGLYCCGSGGVCCGTGCCASEQTCEDGRCVASGGPVTVTSITYQTITRVVTQVATVLLVVVDTSTAVSTTEVTISSAETQTNLVWITSTVVAKRSLPTHQALLVKKEDTTLEPRLSWSEAIRAAWASVTARRLPHVISDAVLDRRQATRDPSAAAESTITVFDTQTTAVTNVVSTTVTTQTTSFVMTTVVVTRTIVLNAKTTIDVTSVMTFTSHQPVTQTITTTQNPVISTGASPGTTSTSPTKSPTLVPPPGSASTSIQTPAIVGIAVGGTVFAIIITSIIIFLVRYRHKKAAHNDNPNADLPPDVNALDIRQPSFPILTHFAAAAPAAHHGADFQPPSDTGQKASAYLDHTKPSPDSSMNRHHRNSSGVTTLVSTPFFGTTVANGNGNGNGARAGDRVSAMTTVSGRTSFSVMPPVSAVEVPGSGAEWYTNDAATNNLVQTGAESPPGATRESPRLSQQRMPPQRSSEYGSAEPRNAVTLSTYIPNDAEVYRQAVEEAYIQTEPGELDAEDSMVREMGSGRREEDDENLDGIGYLQPQYNHQMGHSWSSQQRYDGHDYGDPDSRSPSVAPH